VVCLCRNVVLNGRSSAKLCKGLDVLPPVVEKVTPVRVPQAEKLLLPRLLLNLLSCHMGKSSS
jgi:hypothetical protein